MFRDGLCKGIVFNLLCAGRFSSGSVGDDLLYAVTHSPKEVKAYYAKYNVNRDDVLRTIKSELKKLNIKVNLNLILAEVERNIIEDDFQNNFMKSIKRKVSDFAIALASRND